MVIKQDILIIIGVLLIVSSCKSIKPNDHQKSTNQNIIISEIKKSNFGESDSVEVISNKSNTLLLFINQSIINAGNPTSNLKFVVFENLGKRVIYKNEYSNSLVKWYSDKELLLTRFMGIIEDKASSNIKYFIINLQTNEIIEVESSIINP
jgi:hypothetical protein